MILGFCGRMRSGKTELAKVCVEKGFTKLYFALPLKQLCADILDVSIDELNRLKGDNTDISLQLNDDICKILSEETDIPLDVVKETCLGKTISTVREMLQFIGTDLIRQYNKDWHVNRIREMINPDINYVIDDVRFPNEKKLIEELGGDCWFIIRPTLDNVSNHESETSLSFNDCWNRIIINDGTLQLLLFKWTLFLGDYEKSCAIRDKEFDRILETCDKGGLEKMTILDILLISKWLFDYVPKEINKEDVRDIKMTESGGVQITYNDDSIEMIYNPLNIEEIKLIL
jgi:hypothetical protein